VGVNDWLNYLGGLIRVRIKGNFPERVVNMALTRGVILTDIKRDGPDLSFTTRVSGFPALQSIAEQLGFEVEVLKKEGLPFYRRFMKERFMLLAGGLVFVIVLYFFSSFIMYLNVIGNTSITSSAIMNSAAHYGLYQWANRRNLDKNKVAQGIMEDIPLLSYVEVNIRGVKATIKVVEKTVPNVVESGPCHLVASKDGVIAEVLVFDGQAEVAKGDTVGVGDILISGVIDPPEEQVLPGEPPPPRLVRAQGSVKARVWYEGYGEYPLVQQKITPTGRSSETVILTTPWGKRTIKLARQHFKSYKLVLWNKGFPTPWGKVALTRKIYLETRVTAKENQPKQAENRAKEEALQNLRREIGKAERVLDTRVRMISSPSDTIVRFKATAEVLEEITRTEPINVENQAQGSSTESGH
jgi:similar to stage IV sporulation protein